MRDLFPQIRRAGVAKIALQLGLTVLDWPAPGSIAPCPGCAAPQRGSGDRRGPIGLHRDGLGWICHRCKASGDACSLAALVITGNPKPDSEGWKQVRHKFIGAALPTYQPPPREEPKRPPLEEVLDIWNRATSVYDSPELVPILEERCLDPGELTERDLCRVCPPGHLPNWATYIGQDWNQTGHLCLFPFYDHRGELVSLHARRMEDGAPKPKGVSPLRYETKGLCFVDGLGRAMLQGRLSASLLVIAEGPPDFLTASLSFGEENLSSAVVGVVSGSWTPEWAAQVPAQTHVQIATHEDSSGERYAQQIAKTFPQNQATSRWRAPQ